MKITKFYIENAKYRTVDEGGGVIWVDINYWNNSFSLSKSSGELENLARNLLTRKHKVNFAHKLLK